VAVVVLRTSHLTQVRVDDDLVALRLLVDRRDELGRTRTQTVNRLHRLLLELAPGGAKRFLIRPRPNACSTASPRPTRPAGYATSSPPNCSPRSSCWTVDEGLRQDATHRGHRDRPGLLALYGIGPAGAARILGDIGDVARFATRSRFASWNGTAPLDASSGDQKRHRLSRAGNRRINRTLCTSWPSSRFDTTPKVAPTAADRPIDTPRRSSPDSPRPGVQARSMEPSIRPIC
jgi:hypothetical protein